MASQVLAKDPILNNEDKAMTNMKSTSTTQAQAPEVNYLSRAKWLRAAVLGAADGLVSVASLMIGVGAINQTSKSMLISGFAGLVAGACSMAIGEFVSVYAQHDIELAQMKRSNEQHDVSLPKPFQAAGASALAFAIGGLLPLLSGSFIEPWWIRVSVVCGVTSLALAGFGAVAALLGAANVVTAAVRVLFGGWMALAISYGVLKLFGLALDNNS